MTIEVTIVPDTEESLEAEIAALETDTERAIVEGVQRLSRLSARLADLSSRLQKFEPSKQQKETKQ